MPHVDQPALAPFELVFDGVVPNSHATKIVGAERFRVCLFPETKGGRRDACGATCYWLEFQFLDIAKRQWEPILCIHEAKLSVVLSVLEEVRVFLEQPRD